MEKIVLCGKAACCPEITKIGEDEYQIEDDYTNIVIMTKDQLQELVNKFESGEIY